MEIKENSSLDDLTPEQKTEVLTRINEFSNQLSTYNNDLKELKLIEFSKELSKDNGELKEIKEEFEKANIDTEETDSKKVNIFTIVSVVRKMKKATLSINNALQADMKFQEKMLKYQQETTKFMDFLFSLETSSMAANAFITKELEEALGGGSLSKEKIGEEAFEKVFSVASRIKEQRSLFVRQKDLEDRVFKLEEDNEVLKQDIADLKQGNADLKNGKNKFNKSKLFWVLFSILAFFSIAGFVFGIICLLQK